MVETDTTGRSTCGYSRTGRLVSEAMPPTISIRLTTTAKTGRRMKRSETCMALSDPGCGQTGGHHLRSAACALPTGCGRLRELREDGSRLAAGGAAGGAGLAAVGGVPTW